MGVILSLNAIILIGLSFVILFYCYIMGLPRCLFFPELIYINLSIFGLFG